MSQHSFLLQNRPQSQDLNLIYFKEMIKLLSEIRRPMIFKKGDCLFEEGTCWDKIYFITEGQINIGSYNPQGKKIINAILRKGELVGELSLKEGIKQDRFAKASKKTSAFVLTLMEYRSLMRKKVVFAYFLIDKLDSRCQLLEERLHDVYSKSSRTRVVEFLINLIKAKGQRIGFEFLFRDFFTHKEIADLTSTSRQTVTTVLNELRNKKILTFNRKRLLVRDIELLMQEID